MNKILSENVISLPGVSNARELGGYPVEKGYIRKGALLRSGALARALPEAVQTLHEKYRLQTVVDFRMKDKRKNAPDAEIPGAKNIHLPVVEMVDYASDFKSPAKLAKFISKIVDRNAFLEMAFEYGLLGPKIYAKFLLGERGKKAYREFFKILLENDPDKGALLWHCDEGKDRAGLASMLLLSVLGADRETIFEDYLMTNVCNADVIEAIKKDYEAYNMPQDKLNAMIFASGGVFDYYLTFALETLEEKYGGVMGYLQKELGLTEADFELLRGKYVACS